MSKINWLTQTPIAHRGLHDHESPENSLASFKKGMALGHALEFDIHLTKDKKLVVFHDKNTQRMCTVSKEISQSNYSELRDLKLLKTNEGIPLLEEVLSLVNGKVPLLIEIKDDGPDGVLEKELIKVMDKYHGQFAIQSFNPWSLKHLRALKEDYTLGMLSGSFKYSKLHFFGKVALKSLLFASVIKPNFFSLEYEFYPWYQQLMVKLYPSDALIFWTIKDDSLGKKILKAGHGIIYEKMVLTK
ncbi:hypothetical protein A9Q84_11095 [Halobacteriovorax marinus]|uniref:GP-PDE domain-containing protein n=1 Tax=Halobacteriovorax marinus TaxID=97084 RepID=A0A1Y5F803_9BACT|nr:hypothetical protein A9Q84_11095 [Halobacteriovorax marinus]